MLELTSTLLKYTVSIKYVSISINCAHLCARARRWRTPFVDPPRAYTTVIAFSNACSNKQIILQSIQLDTAQSTMCDQSLKSYYFFIAAGIWECYHCGVCSGRVHEWRPPPPGSGTRVSTAGADTKILDTDTVLQNSWCWC